MFVEPQRPRLRITAGAAVIVALVVAAVVVLAVALQPRPAGGVPALAAPTATSLDAVPVDAAPAPVETPAATALVHVLGQVPSPGVYEIGPGGRVVDAIAAAGGLTDEADTAAVNLARPVVDGEQIYVPAIGETPPVPPGGGDAEGASDGTGSAGGLVNLNTATAAQLETLPRIGPAMAQRIIDHREANGPFAAVDDLIDVAGIGEATLEGLRPLVTV
ncbi:MAG: ComEA family DNA-binding protein [Microbacteriaceae bacterium]|nr:ComEA family DNA-binding protein [Microbacteriaceae bacterium]